MAGNLSGTAELDQVLDNLFADFSSFLLVATDDYGRMLTFDSFRQRGMRFQVRKSWQGKVQYQQKDLLGPKRFKDFIDIRRDAALEVVSFE